MTRHRLLAMPRSFSTNPSRRHVLRGLAGAGLALAVPRLPDTIAAKKHHQRKRKKAKLKRNAFGCVNVGGHCLGNSANCCSGICEGKKPKKGKKDTSVYVAHDDAGICFPDNDTCVLGGGVRGLRRVLLGSVCRHWPHGLHPSLPRDNLTGLG